MLGWVKGFLGVVGTLLLESILHWAGLEIMLFLIMEEGTQAVLAVPWGQLSRGDGLEKPGPLLIEEEWTVLDLGSCSGDLSSSSGALLSSFIVGKSDSLLFLVLG